MTRPAVTLDSTVLRQVLPLARLQVERSATDRISLVSIGCRWEGRFQVSDTFIEDARDPAAVLRECISMYWSAHRAPHRAHVDEYLPTLTCGRCKGSVELPDFAALSTNDQLEVAERMAVKWMERADQIRRSL